MIEENLSELLNYGALGLWTLSLLYQQFANQKQVQEAQKANTIALTKVYELMGDIEKYMLKKKVTAEG